MTPHQYLRDCRIKLGLSQADVALAVGMSRSALGWLENGRTKRLTLDMASKLCRHYRVSIVVLDALVNGEPLVKGL